MEITWRYLVYCEPLLIYNVHSIQLTGKDCYENEERGGLTRGSLATKMAFVSNVVMLASSLAVVFWVLVRMGVFYFVNSTEQ